MRFEQMTFEEQIKSLTRLHKRINKDFFDNKLKTIHIDIASIKTEEHPDGIAKFTRNAVLFDQKTKSAYLGECICFAWELVDCMAELKTQKEQALVAGGVMLHEMVHQYCFENGIDDTNHGGRWEETAREHNLISIYRDGKQIEDNPSETARLWFYNFYRL